jgi:hypothetical protein
MKKNLLASFMVISGLCVTAHGESPCTQSFQGFYVGAHGGYGQISEDARSTGIIAANAGNVEFDGEVSKGGILGGLQLGYGQFAQGKTFLGFEIFGSMGDHKGKLLTQGTGAAVDDESLETKLTWQGGGALRLGYEWGATLPYVRIGGGAFGLEWKSWKNPDPVTKTTKTTPFVSGGLGVAFSVNPKLSWGAEYDYRYGTQKESIKIFIDGTGAYREEFKTRPMVSTLSLRLNYKVD